MSKFFKEEGGGEGSLLAGGFLSNDRGESLSACSFSPRPTVLEKEKSFFQRVDHS